MKNIFKCYLIPPLIKQSIMASLGEAGMHQNANINLQENASLRVMMVSVS